jgi:hypothetical protein
MTRINGAAEGTVQKHPFRATEFRGEAISDWAVIREEVVR